MNKIKLFIVDDELGSRELLAYFLLQKQELEIVGNYGDGIQLLQEIEKHKPDIIFTDILMPCMNGIESAKKIQKLFPDIRFVFVTAHSKFRDTVKKVNSLGFLLKPVDPEELDNCIEKIKKQYAKVYD